MIKKVSDSKGGAIFELQDLNWAPFALYGHWKFASLQLVMDHQNHRKVGVKKKHVLSDEWHRE